MDVQTIKLRLSFLLGGNCKLVTPKRHVSWICNDTCKFIFRAKKEMMIYEDKLFQETLHEKDLILHWTFRITLNNFSTVKLLNSATTAFTKN